MSYELYDDLEPPEPHTGHEPFVVSEIQLIDELVPEGWVVDPVFDDDGGYPMVAIYDPARYDIITVPGTMSPCCGRELTASRWECCQTGAQGSLWFRDKVALANDALVDRIDLAARALAEPSPQTRPSPPDGPEVPGL